MEIKDDIPSWVIEEFENDPLIREGNHKFEKWSFIDKLLFLHLMNVFSDYYEKFYPQKILVDVFISKNDSPIIKVLRSKKYRNLGLIVVSMGMIKAIATLSARMVVVYESDKRKFFFLKSKSNFNNVSKSYIENLFEGFSLSEFKIKHCGFTTPELTKLASLIRGDNFSAFLEVLATSMEFLFLHEIAHIIFFHSLAKDRSLIYKLVFDKLGFLKTDSETKKYDRPVAKIERCLEHHADLFALRTMFFIAPKRPCLERIYTQFGTKSIFEDRNSRKMLSFIGGAVCFSFVSLMDADENQSIDSIIVADEAHGSHPLPTIRLKMATLMLAEEMKSPMKRLFLWRKEFFNKNFHEKLVRAQFYCSLYSMICVKSNWRNWNSVNDRSDPYWIDKFLHHDRNFQAILGSSIMDDFKLANELIREVRKK